MNSSTKKKEENYPDLTSFELAERSVEILVDNKGLDVKLINISDFSDITDLIIIVSGTSERHVKTLCNKVVEFVLEDFREKPICIDGSLEGQWAIIDYGNLMIHVFHEKTRNDYEFDKLFVRGEKVTVNDELQKVVNKSRTGMFP